MNNTTTQTNAAGATSPANAPAGAPANAQDETPAFQIYCDRGNGPELDGCWGSEHAKFSTEEDAQEAIDGENGLAENYPDVEWLILPIKLNA